MVREVCFNVILALFFLQFAVIHARHLGETFQLSTLLLLLKISTDVCFYLTRRIPKDVSISVYDWFVAIVGTWGVLFLVPGNRGYDVPEGQAIQLLGVTLQILAMLSLNRSIGMVPANREIKTHGFYRFVRHPLYLSYVVSYGGYLICHPTSRNLFVYVLAVLLWTLRLLAEERFLLRSPEYQQYAKQVRWRMIPGLF